MKPENELNFESFKKVNLSTIKLPTTINSYNYIQNNKKNIYTKLENITKQNN